MYQTGYQIIMLFTNEDAIQQKGSISWKFLTSHLRIISTDRDSAPIKWYILCLTQYLCLQFFSYWFDIWEKWLVIHWKLMIAQNKFTKSMSGVLYFASFFPCLGKTFILHLCIIRHRLASHPSEQRQYPLESQVQIRLPMQVV